LRALVWNTSLSLELFPIETFTTVIVTLVAVVSVEDPFRVKVPRAPEPVVALLKDAAPLFT